MSLIKILQFLCVGITNMGISLWLSNLLSGRLFIAEIHLNAPAVILMSLLLKAIFFCGFYTLIEKIIRFILLNLNER